MVTRKLRQLTRMLSGAAVLIGAAFGFEASATTITFDGFSDPTHTVVSSYAESGFTVTPTVGTWAEGQFEGNPTPSIFASPADFGTTVNTISVTNNGDPFTFGGLAFALNSGSSNYELQGIRNGTTIFDVSGSEVGPDFVFGTLGAGLTADVIDTLNVTINSGNVDNIVVNPVIPASAATITFNGFTDPTHTPVTAPYNEAGYTVTPTLGTFAEGQFFGNPVPSIFASPSDFGAEFNQLTVTKGGAPFTFNALDFAANFGTTDYEFQGTLGGVPVFDLSGTEPGRPEVFDTFASGVATKAIDTLTINLDIHGVSANIDNIVLNAVSEVPEPASGVIFASGLVLLALWRRRETVRSPTI